MRSSRVRTMPRDVLLSGTYATPALERSSQRIDDARSMRNDGCNCAPRPTDEPKSAAQSLPNYVLFLRLCPTATLPFCIPSPSAFIIIRVTNH